MAKIGLQLYSLRNVLDAENFNEIIREVGEVGYDGVEFYKFYNKPASEVKSVLNDYGLEPISSHVAIDKLREDFDETLEYHEEIGCDTIIVPYLPAENFESRSTIRETSNELSELAEKASARGFDFGYHNHWHEFFTLDSTTAFEVFAKEVPNSVGLQPDVGHVQRGGIDPVGLLKELDNRFVSFHIKDIGGKKGVDIPLGGELTVEEAEKLGGKFEDVRLGNGVVDLPGVLDLGEKLGVSWFIVEDESAEDLEAVDIDYKYLDSL